MLIFYSWQSDLPNPTNRSLIERALEQAGKQLRSEKVLSVEPVIDRDTQGIAGTPDISSSIFSKIAEADFFVADVSIINSDTPAGRPTPNPNVLIELGYAIGVKGWQRIILVHNLAYGGHDQLPFDLRQRRTVTYCFREGDDPTLPKSELVSRLKIALRDIIASLKRQPLLPSLSLVDSDFLKAVFESALTDTGMANLIQHADFENAANSLGLSVEQALESIEVLESAYVIEIHHESGGGLPSGKLTDYGIALCLEHFVPNCDELVHRVFIAYTKDGLSDAAEISTSTGSSLALTNFVLWYLQSEGYMRLDHYFGDKGYKVRELTTKGSRAAGEKQ